MKKVILFLTISSFLFSGCGGNSTEKKIKEVKESLYGVKFLAMTEQNNKFWERAWLNIEEKFVSIKVERIYDLFDGSGWQQVDKNNLQYAIEIQENGKILLNIIGAKGNSNIYEIRTDSKDRRRLVGKVVFEEQK